MVETMIDGDCTLGSFESDVVTVYTEAVVLI